MVEDDAQLSDEELRKLLKPNPSDEEVVAIVKSSFANSQDEGVEILKDLESYDDRNFWMRIGGIDHLVKIHNGVESMDLCKAMERGAENSVIQFQYEIMKKLAENGICASRPIFSRESQKANTELPCIKELPVVSPLHSPAKLAVSAYAWVPGTTMSSLKMLPVECLADAGQFLGKLHQKLDLISVDKVPAARRYHQWDGKNTSDLKDFLQYIRDEGRRDMISSILKAFNTDLIESGVASKFRKSVNHGDFNGKLDWIRILNGKLVLSLGSCLIGDLIPCIFGFFRIQTPIFYWTSISKCQESSILAILLKGASPICYRSRKRSTN